MNRNTERISMLFIGLLLNACGPKDPVPALPDYLQLPTTLSDYPGSGLISLNGDMFSLRVAGPEQLNATTQTYAGVGGSIVGEDVNIHFTDGQPRPYRDLSLVPPAYWSYGDLTLYRSYSAGTYPMGGQSTPSPRGEVADLTMNLPGPQLYVNNGGSLTIRQSTLLRSENGLALYRLEGTFRAEMYADGLGIPVNRRNPVLAGTFDVLLVKK